MRDILVSYASIHPVVEVILKNHIVDTFCYLEDHATEKSYRNI